MERLILKINEEMNRDWPPIKNDRPADSLFCLMSRFGDVKRNVETFVVVVVMLIMLMWLLMTWLLWNQLFQIKSILSILFFSDDSFFPDLFFVWRLELFLSLCRVCWIILNTFCKVGTDYKEIILNLFYGLSRLEKYETL